MGNPKNKLDNEEKSGIYKIGCKDCDKKYVRLTRSFVHTKFKEHMVHLQYSRCEKSSVTEHISLIEH